MTLRPLGSAPLRIGWRAVLVVVPLSLSLLEQEAPRRHAFHGLALAVVQTTSQAGEIRLTASAESHQPASVTLRSIAVNPEPGIVSAEP